MRVMINLHQVIPMSLGASKSKGLNRMVKIE